MPAEVGLNALGVVALVALCLPAFALAKSKSGWLVDYAIWLFVLNRGIRRVVDYYSGGFNPKSLVLLAPLIVSAIAAYMVISRLNTSRTTRKGKKVLTWFIWAGVLALAVGLVRNQLAALVELGTYLGLFGLLGYGIQYCDEAAIVKRWRTTAVYAGLAAVIYGIYQFHTIPPWDAAWLKGSGLVGYMGWPSPGRMTLYSTLAERGPAKAVFAVTIILLVIREKWSPFLRYPLVGASVYALLLTYARTGIIQVVVAIACSSIYGKGRGLGAVAALAVASVLFGGLLLGSLGSDQKLQGRLQSFGNLSEDGSANSRVTLFLRGLTVVATEPYGLGFGAQGGGSRLENGETGAVVDATGFLSVLQTFGWIGAGLFFSILWTGWQSCRRLMRSTGDPDALLLCCLFVSGAVAFIGGNWLPHVPYIWVLLGVVIGRTDRLSASGSSLDFTSPFPFLDPVQPPPNRD